MSTVRLARTLRFPEEALAEIDRQARQHGLNRTDYIIKASTGDLPHTTSEALRRIEALEEAVECLQALAYAPA